MRICPFHGCVARIPDHVFACLGHWRALGHGDKIEVYAAFDAYMMDEIDLEELRAKQQAILGDRGNARKADGEPESTGSRRSPDP